MYHILVKLLISCQKSTGDLCIQFKLLFTVLAPVLFSQPPDTTPIHPPLHHPSSPCSPSSGEEEGSEIESDEDARRKLTTRHVIANLAPVGDWGVRFITFTFVLDCQNPGGW